MKFLFKFLLELECLLTHWWHHEQILIVRNHLGTFYTYRCNKCKRTWEDIEERYN